LKLDTNALKAQRAWLLEQPSCDEVDGLIDLIDNLLAAQSMLDRLLAGRKPSPLFERLLNR
jgi:hypothetical protein